MDERAAELLEFVLSGRPERVADLLLATVPPEARAELRRTAEVISRLGLAAPPLAPQAALRARILGTIAARLARPAARKALVVCDMQNDHLMPGRPLTIPRAVDIVPALKRRIEEARAAGDPVVYVVDHHTPDDAELDAWGAHNIAGTEGAEVWPEIAPQEGDVIVSKPSFSAFFQSKLDDVLTERMVDTLVLTGCATEIQLMATATDALQRGFAVEMPPDCQAGTNPVAEQVSLGVLAALVPYQPAREARLARIGAGGGPPRSVPPPRG